MRRRPGLCCRAGSWWQRRQLRLLGGHTLRHLGTRRAEALDGHQAALGAGPAALAAGGQTRAAAAALTAAPMRAALAVALTLVQTGRLAEGRAGELTQVVQGTLAARRRPGSGTGGGATRSDGGGGGGRPDGALGRGARHTARHNRTGLLVAVGLHEATLLVGSAGDHAARHAGLRPGLRVEPVGQPVLCHQQRLLGHTGRLQRTVGLTAAVLGPLHATRVAVAAPHGRAVGQAHGQEQTLVALAAHLGGHADGRRRAVLAEGGRWRQVARRQRGALRHADALGTRRPVALLHLDTGQAQLVCPAAAVTGV